MFWLFKNVQKPDKVNKNTELIDAVKAGSTVNISSLIQDRN